MCLHQKSVTLLQQSHEKWPSVVHVRDLKILIMTIFRDLKENMNQCLNEVCET